MLHLGELCKTRPFRAFVFAVLGAALNAPAGVDAAEIRAEAAHKFVNSIGVATHFNWSSSPYTRQYGQVKALLQELGIRHIRDAVGTPSAGALYRDLNSSLGVKLNGVIDTRTGSGAGTRLNPGGIPELIDKVRSLSARVVSAVEGPNEFNNIERDYGYGGWAQDVRAYQQQIYSRMKGDAQLRAIAVVGPSLSDPIKPGNYSKLGNISGMTDFGNAHVYPNWLNWEQKINDVLPFVRTSFPGKRVVVTETGYHQAFNSGAMWVSDNAILKYLPRAMATMASHPDLRRGFIYQLVEAHPDPGRVQPPYNMALVEYDLRRKIRYYAVRNTMHVMCDNPLSFAPQSLRYSLTGNLANVRSNLYQKGNRSFYLVLRVEKQSFQSGRDINNPPQAVTLRFEQAISQARIFLPSDQTGGIANSNQPKRTVTNPNTLDLNVPDALMIVEITPAGTAKPAVSTNCNFSAT